MVINTKLVNKTKASKSTTFAYEYNESYLYIMCKNTWFYSSSVWIQWVGKSVLKAKDRQKAIVSIVAYNK